MNRRRKMPRTERDFLDERYQLALIELKEARKINQTLARMRVDAEVISATDVDTDRPRMKACA
jgi:hypothetical protein